MSKKRHPPRIPLYAAGIRAQETRGGGRAWWAREWMRRIEGMGLKGRLGRGRNYAATGQVVSLETSGSLVSATVQGSRRDPYSVTVDFRRPSPDALRRIAAKIAAEPMVAARLFADDLPEEAVKAFADEGFDLFPGGRLGPGRYDVTTSCSCPDYANPCKHAAAVLLLIGEAAARRPMTLLELRGLRPEDICRED